MSVRIVDRQSSILCFEILQHYVRETGGIELHLLTHNQNADVAVDPIVDDSSFVVTFKKLVTVAEVFLSVVTHRNIKFK